MTSPFSNFYSRSLRRFYKKNRLLKVRKKKKFFRKLLRRETFLSSKRSFRFFKNKRLNFLKRYLYVRQKLQLPSLLKGDLLRKRKIKFLRLKSRYLKKKNQFLRIKANYAKIDFLKKFKALCNFLKKKKKTKFSFFFNHYNIKCFWTCRKQISLKNTSFFKTRKNISLKYFFSSYLVSNIKARYFFFLLFNLRKNIFNSFVLDIY